MKRYVVFHDSCMLMIDQGDPIPTMAEIEEAERFEEALAAGDPRVELTAMDDRPGCFEASWFSTARVS